MIDSLIASVARRNFARGMAFDMNDKPGLPAERTGRPCLLYIHIPFCEKLCPYCSFNRVEFDEKLCRGYFAALKKEMCLYKNRGFGFQGMYVGGGTPTIMIDELIDTLALAKEFFHVKEISVETNPNHLTDDNIGKLKNAGVKRLSVGVQSFDDGLLRAMERFERYGSGSSVAARLKEIAGTFETLNVDMIFNFPTQTMEMLNRDIDTLLGAEIDQVTYYPLMVSSETREVVRKALGRVSDKMEKEFYGIISSRLVPPYRFSSAWCFSRKPGMIDEYVVEYGEYAGLGSGSIGYLSGACYANTFKIGDYIELVNRGEVPVMASRLFSVRDQARYDFLMKLFGSSLDMRTMRMKYGGEVDRHLAAILFAFRAVGAIRYDADKDCYYLTDRGRYYWVVMMREFFTAVNNFRDFCRG